LPSDPGKIDGRSNQHPGSLSESQVRLYIRKLKRDMRPRPMLTPLRNRFFHATVAALALFALGSPAHAQYVGREQDIGTLRLGQRILVDDGTCPAGQVKELSGSKMTATGVVPTRKCVPRLPKKSGK
jgi:hypothetical protein